LRRLFAQQLRVRPASHVRMRIIWLLRLQPLVSLTLASDQARQVRRNRCKLKI